MDLLKRPNRVTLAELMKATGWQAHSVADAQAARTALERYREIEVGRPLVEEEREGRTSTISKLAQWTK